MKSSNESSEVLRIGIMSMEKMRERTIAIARGEYKREPDEPKVWFSSIKSLSEVLSDRNRDMLKLIALEAPESIKELADLTGRKPNNLSRTLATMESCGIIELVTEKRRRRPVVKATKFLIHTY